MPEKKDSQVYVRVPHRLRVRLKKWIDQKRLSDVVVPFLERLVDSEAATTALELAIADKEHRVDQLKAELEADRQLLTEILAASDAARAREAKVDAFIKQARHQQQLAADALREFKLEAWLKAKHVDEDVAQAVLAALRQPPEPRRAPANGARTR
jgi:hypothetical protein